MKDEAGIPAFLLHPSAFLLGRMAWDLVTDWSFRTRAPGFFGMGSLSD
jgi:hypothetical protein